MALTEEIVRITPSLGGHGFAKDPARQESTGKVQAEDGLGRLWIQVEEGLDPGVLQVFPGKRICLPLPAGGYSRPHRYIRIPIFRNSVRMSSLAETNSLVLQNVDLHRQGCAALPSISPATFPRCLPPL